MGWLCAALNPSVARRFFYDTQGFGLLPGVEILGAAIDPEVCIEAARNRDTGTRLALRRRCLRKPLLRPSRKGVPASARSRCPLNPCWLQPVPRLGRHCQR